MKEAPKNNSKTTWQAAHQKKVVSAREGVKNQKNREGGGILITVMAGIRERVSKGEYRWE